MFTWMLVMLNMPYPQDFKCKQCPSVAYTVGLGLVSFFSSVFLVLFTAVTNFAEGFGEQAQRHTRGANRQDGIELGDVVKVRNDLISPCRSGNSRS